MKILLITYMLVLLEIESAYCVIYVGINTQYGCMVTSVRMLQMFTMYMLKTDN